MEEENKSLESKPATKIENIIIESKDELIKILIEMKQEQQKSNNIIKKLFIGLIIFLIPTIITIMFYTIQICQYVF